MKNKGQAYAKQVNSCAKAINMNILLYHLKLSEKDSDEAKETENYKIRMDDCRRRYGIPLCAEALSQVIDKYLGNPKIKIVYKGQNRTIHIGMDLLQEQFASLREMMGI